MPFRPSENTSSPSSARLYAMDLAGDEHICNSCGRTKGHGEMINKRFKMPGLSARYRHRRICNACASGVGRRKANWRSAKRSRLGQDHEEDDDEDENTGDKVEERPYQEEDEDEPTLVEQKENHNGQQGEEGKEEPTLVRQMDEVRIQPEISPGLEKEEEEKEEGADLNMGADLDVVADQEEDQMEPEVRPDDGGEEEAEAGDKAAGTGGVGTAGVAATCGVTMLIFGNEMLQRYMFDPQLPF